MNDSETLQHECILDFGVAGRRHVTVIAAVRDAGEFAPLIEVDLRSIKVHLPKADIATGLDSFEALHLIDDHHLVDVREALEKKFTAYQEHQRAQAQFDFDSEGPGAA